MYGTEHDANYAGSAGGEDVSAFGLKHDIVMPRRLDGDNDGVVFVPAWSKFVQSNGELVYPKEHCPRCEKPGVVDAWGRRYLVYRLENNRHYLGHVCEGA